MPAYFLIFGNPHAWHAENTVKSFPAEVLIYKYLTQLFVVR